MFVDDVKASAEHRLSQVTHTLKHVHGMELKLDESSLDDIVAMHDSSEIVKNSIVSESAFNSWHNNPSYTKHMLIMEAARLYLTEIAPKRRPRQLRESVEIPQDSAFDMGTWMMDFAQNARTKDDNMLAVLNSFSRVGDDLIRIGEPFGMDTLKALLSSYEARANDESNDEHDRKQAKDNLMALRVAKRLYDKHAQKKDKVDEASVDHMADRSADQTTMDPELAALMKKYGIDAGHEMDEEITDEGNEFTGALAAAKAAHKDKFKVGDKEYNVSETEDAPTASRVTPKNLGDITHTEIQPGIEGAQPVGMLLHMMGRTLGKMAAAGAIPSNQMINVYRAKIYDIMNWVERNVKNGKKVVDELASIRSGAGNGVELGHGTLPKDWVRDAARKLIDTRMDLYNAGYKMGSSNLEESKGKTLKEDHMQHHDYQASMARSELYRNVKYGMDMLKMIRKEDEIEPWIAANLTSSAAMLDKIYHYMDYYMNAEPGVLDEDAPQPDYSMDDEDMGDGDEELGETSGSIARMNLLGIVEDSMKLFHMIQPGDHLEGWVAMKLTRASGAISGAKHFLDYKNFEKHASEDFDLKEGADKSAPDSKDFKMVADMIKSHPDPEARHHMAKHHAEVFARKNPKFNAGRFYARAKAPRSIAKAELHENDSPEQDLQHAQTLIAAKSISDDLQSMAEKVARMGVDDLMPLVDTMKGQFGPEAADAYNEVMKTQLEDLLQSVQTAKDQSDNAVLALQSGSIPGQGTSDIENMDTGAPAAAEQPSDGQGTTPAAAAGNAPLGRAKKEAPDEPEVELEEAWGTEMRTAEKDKGKWDGYTIADLKAKKKKLMDKESRSAAEQKTVKQIDFAIRAKQTDKFGAIKEAAKKSKSPYAIGMYQAKKEAGMDPNKPAHDLSKKVVARAHEIGASIEGTNESVARLGKLLEKALRGKRKYEADLAEHRTLFAQRVTEGKVKDLLKTGQGLEGDLLEKKIAEVMDMADDLKQQMRVLESDSKAKLLAAIKEERKAARFDKAKATKPWGVMYESQGKRKTKFFEDQKARDYWAQLNDTLDVALINPEHFDAVAAK